MKRPTVSVCLTIHDRPDDVLREVFRSIDGQSIPPDQVVICLDRSPDHVRECLEALRIIGPYGKGHVEVVELAGRSGWRGPATAWNAALARVTSEITLMLSSETVQGERNIELAGDIIGIGPCVLVGKATDSSGTQQVTGFPPGLLCSSEYPRPLGFTWAMPTWALRAIGGFDERYMEGLCYDDDDISYRLWKLGLPFVFHDDMWGVHQYHERPGLRGKEAQEKIARNRAYIIDKFSGDTLPGPRENPLNSMKNAGRGLIEKRLPGVRIWEMPPAEKARRRYSLLERSFARVVNE